MNHIDVVEVTNPNGYIVQELTIDGASLGQWLDKHTEGSEDEHIAAFIRPFSELLFAWSHDIDWKGDRRFVRTLIDMDSAPVPILLCEDDPDFSCIVIVADVEKTEDCVYWNRIGYVTHNGESLEEEMEKGIAYTKSYTDDDWARYGDNIALEDVGSDAWHEWIAKNWDVELYKRCMNYTLPYYKAEGSIKWFINTDWVFDRREYEFVVEKYYALQRLRLSEELLRNSDDELNGAECAKILEEILPMGEEALQKQLDEYGEILFDPYICDVIASPLNDLVRRKEPDKILLETYLNALKILKKHGDIHVRNNLEISILDDFDEERAAFRKYGLMCDEL